MREGIKGKRGEVGEERRGDMRSGEQPHIMSGLQAAVHREKDSSLLRARAKYKRRDRFWRLCTGPRTAGSPRELSEGAVPVTCLYLRER